MRNYKEATQDPANARLAETIMEALAPSGFQEHAKYGEVAIRNALSKKECMDITYKLILQVSQNKIQLLKNVRKEIDDLDRKIKSQLLTIEDFRAEYGSNFWMWLSGRLWQYRNMELHLKFLLGRQDEIRNCRTAIFLVGPEIPKEVLEKYSL